MVEIGQDLHTCLHISKTAIKFYIYHSVNTQVYTHTLSLKYVHAKSCTAGTFLSSVFERTLTKQGIKPIMFELSSDAHVTVGRTLSCDTWLVKACLTG